MVSAVLLDKFALGAAKLVAFNGCVPAAVVRAPGEMMGTFSGRKGAERGFW